MKMWGMFLFVLARNASIQAALDRRLGALRIWVLIDYVWAAILLVMAVATLPLTLPLATLEWGVRALFSPATCKR